MRNTDEQMQEILSRAGNLRARRNLKKRLWLSGGSCVLSLALLIFVAVCLTKLSALTEASTPGEYGSLILGTPALGYVLFGLLCFVLGASAVLFCLSLRRWKGRDL